MACKTGQTNRCGSCTWLVRIYVGRDPESGDPRVHFFKRQRPSQLFAPFVAGADWTKNRNSKRATRSGSQ